MRLDTPTPRCAQRRPDAPHEHSRDAQIRLQATRETLEPDRVPDRDDEIRLRPEPLLAQPQSQARPLQQSWPQPQAAAAFISNPITQGKNEVVLDAAYMGGEA